MAPAPLWAGRRVVVCAGTGGVGKTTVSAALATAAACSGLRVLVMTIDPARRLAQIFGLPMQAPKDASALYHPIPAARLAAHGLHVTGSLTAFLPDVKATFDDLMQRYAASPEAAARIMGNTIYKNFSTALAGSHEYAAVETLYAAHASADYDLIVLDTPPSQNVVDFLQAPRRILNFLDVSQVPKLLSGSLLTGRLSMRLFDIGEALVTRTLGKVVGADTLAEVGAFILSLRDMYAGFHQRAGDVDALLRAPELVYVLVGTPSPTQQRAMWQFDGELRTFGAKTGGVVLNRMHSAPVAAEHQGQLAAVLEQSLAGVPAAAQASIRAALEAEAAAAAQNNAAMAALAEKLTQATIIALPEMPPDLDELACLAKLAPYFMA
jgi:anion-transporting  ArsA/GET3 family ATPase